MTSTIVVSGASGFIGSALVRKLQGTGWRVRRILRPGSNLSAGDICHDLSSDGILALEPDTMAVVHLAQSRAYRGFPDDPSDMFSVNIRGTQTLLHAAAKANVKCFCMVSSGTVYEPFSGPMSESDAIRPRSYLGASKAAAEMIAFPYAKLMPLSILRLFSPYGPSQRDRLIPDLVDRVRSGRPVVIAGDGDGMTFAPTFVDDICDVITTAVADRWAGIFNVASPMSLSIREAVTIIAQQLQADPKFEKGSGSPIKLVPNLSALSSRYEMQRFRSFESGIIPVLRAAD